MIFKGAYCANMSAYCYINENEPFTHSSDTEKYREKENKVYVAYVRIFFLSLH